MAKGLLREMLRGDNLCAAWESVARNRGAAGTDGVSIARFARHWEENLQRLDELIRTGRYKPARVRRVVIPKRGGGQRVISIATVADRVWQRALLNVLDDRWERVFLDCSYGYRAGRSLRDAVAAILAYRDAGWEYVLDADIDECFDSLNHAVLLEFLAEYIDHPTVMLLVRRWLQRSRPHPRPLSTAWRGETPTPAPQRGAPLRAGYAQSRGAGARGIPLGSPLSPLCCNVYLHRLDVAVMREWGGLVRYADDFVVLCASEAEARAARDYVAEVLRGLQLQLEPRKTRVTSFDEGFEYLGVYFYRDTYSYTWEDKRIEVAGPVPEWLWSYHPVGYE